jgi:integrase
VFRQPKTKHGRRTVTLPPSTVAILRDHRKAKLEQRLFLGLGKARDDALVFTSVDGSPYLPSTPTLQWRRAMRRAGFKETLHSLRRDRGLPMAEAATDREHVEPRRDQRAGMRMRLRSSD